MIKKNQMQSPKTNEDQFKVILKMDDIKRTELNVLISLENSILYVISRFCSTKIQ